MEFRVLGPVEVVDGDQVLPLGGAKPRALLAHLLLGAGGAVSREELYEVIDVLVPNGSYRAVKMNQAVLLALEVPKTNTAGEVTVVAAESSIGRTTPSPARGKL